MMRETSCFSLPQVAVDKSQKTQQLLKYTKINRYRPYRERSNSLLKSLALQQRISFLNSLKGSF